MYHLSVLDYVSHNRQGNGITDNDDNNENKTMNGQHLVY